METRVADHYAHRVDSIDILDGRADCVACGYPFDRGDMCLTTDEDASALYCGCGCLPHVVDERPAIDMIIEPRAPRGWQSIDTSTI